MDQQQIWRAPGRAWLLEMSMLFCYKSMLLFLQSEYFSTFLKNKKTLVLQGTLNVL